MEGILAFNRLTCIAVGTCARKWVDCKTEKELREIQAPQSRLVPSHVVPVKGVRVLIWRDPQLSFWKSASEWPSSDLMFDGSRTQDYEFEVSVEILEVAHESEALWCGVDGTEGQ
jgi:hypothetical protein